MPINIFPRLMDPGVFKYEKKNNVQNWPAIEETHKKGMVSKYGWSDKAIICLGRSRHGLCSLFSMYAPLLNGNVAFQLWFLTVGSSSPL